MRKWLLVILVLCGGVLLCLRMRTAPEHAARRDTNRETTVAHELPPAPAAGKKEERAPRPPPARPASKKPVTSTAESRGTARLRVRVVDDEDRPVGGAAVELLRSTKPEIVKDRRVVDDAGVVEYESVKAGYTSVSVNAGSLSRWRAVTTRAGGTTRIEFVMSGATVEGQVRHVDGHPLEGIELRFRRMNAREEGDALRTTTGAGGHYRVSPVPEGVYLVSTSSTRALPRMRYALLRVGPIPLVHEDFVFGRRSLKGQVRDAGTGRPIEGVHVFLSSPHVFRREQTTDAEGAYCFTDFPRGAARVAAEKRGYARRWADVRISDEETRVVDLEIVAEVRLKILFTDTSGNPIPGHHRVILNAKRGMSRGNSVTTDGDGWGVLDAITPGAYELEVRATGYVTGHSRIDATGGETIVRIRLEPKDAPKRVELRGVVRHAVTNQPIGGVRVRTESQITVVTNSRGEFAFEKIWTKDREFPLWIERDGYAPLRFVVKDRTAPQDVRLQPAARLRLRILDKHGNPVAGERAMYAFKSKEPFFQWALQLETDEDGWVEYHGLLPARYSMSRSGPAGDLQFRLDVPPEGIAHELKMMR